MGEHRQRNIALLVAGTFFMENLDGTILTTAAPSIGRSLGVPSVSIGITITAYLLTLAVLIPLSGWITRRLGSRRVFLAAIAIFTIASALCALSASLPELTIMRVLQGVGGAMMVPVGRLAVLRVTDRADLIRAVALLTWPALVAPIVAPLAGGFITTYFSWHWIFLINLPLGATAFVCTMRWIENTRTHEQHPFDWLTFLFGALASTGAVYGMEKLGGEGDHWQLPAIILTASALCGVLAIVAARRRPTTSLIDLESLGLKTYSLSIYGASAFRIAVSVLPFLLPLMFQIAFGLTAFQSGLYLFALFGGDLLMKVLVIQTLRRWGFRTVLIVNGICCACTMLVCATISPSTPSIIIGLILFVHGATRSLEFSCLTTLAYTEIPPHRMSRANGFLSAIMQFSLGMGIAVGAIALRLAAHAHGHSSALPQLADFHTAIFVVAVLALGPVVDALGLPHNAGASTSGHRQPEPEVNLA